MSGPPPPFDSDQISIVIGASDRQALEVAVETLVEGLTTVAHNFSGILDVSYLKKLQKPSKAKSSGVVRWRAHSLCTASLPCPTKAARWKHLGKRECTKLQTAVTGNCATMAGLATWL